MRITLHEETRLNYAADSLAGLSVGDALGAQYFTVGPRVADLVKGTVPPPVWQWTDDTEMATSVFWMLREAGSVDTDRLAEVFADRCEPNRGYGVGAFVILRRIRQGTPWAVAAAEVFDGQGSCGNGAAMRVAPVGAYFPDSPRQAATQAALSAKVTHTHPEGIAGAIAVAVAASLATAARLDGRQPAASRFIESVIGYTPPGTVRSGLMKASRMIGASVEEAAYTLGNGSGVTAQDTVAFTIWVAARQLADYRAAIVDCVCAGGDIDTTAAIVGGIVAAHTGVDGIPADWLASREPLPPWV